MERGTTLFKEGEEGDLFYIILQGEAEVLKASHQVIEYEGPSASLPLADRPMADKVDAYFKAFKKYYRDIFWPQMDITQDEVDEILGIDGRRKRDANFAKELNQFRQGII